MSIDCRFGPDSATVTLAEPLTQSAVLEIRRHFQLALAYYKLDRIDIEINSPGGEVLALRALAFEIQQLRTRS